MVSVVSSIPIGGNIIFCSNFLKLLDVNFVQKCQICIVNENLHYGILVFKSAITLEKLLLVVRGSRLLNFPGTSLVLRNKKIYCKRELLLTELDVGIWIFTAVQLQKNPN